MILFKNARLYSPKEIGNTDILVSGSAIIAIEENLSITGLNYTTIDLNNQIVTPGFIDQHVHVLGAGGKRGFGSMTNELTAKDLLSVGTTTVVGLLGTDGVTRSPKSLYAKVKGLDDQGMTAYMHTGYYGLDPIHVMNSIQDDLVFIDKVLGCKIAISDIRSSFPTVQELLNKWREVYVGSMLAGKKGILHVHLGNSPSKLDPLFQMVNDYQVPIESISPTHVARTSELFESAIEFGKLGGRIDITTGASKFTDPHRAVLMALEQNLSIDRITFSTDGNAGLDLKDDKQNIIGTKPAPISANLSEFQRLVKSEEISISDSLSIVTSNVSDNLGLNHKGRVKVGADADFCVFNDSWELQNVIAMGEMISLE
jgi:beta-aspartyl-dipeptidase (metallo-type)